MTGKGTILFKKKRGGSLSNEDRRRDLKEVREQAAQKLVEVHSRQRGPPVQRPWVWSLLVLSEEQWGPM